MGWRSPNHHHGHTITHHASRWGQGLKGEMVMVVMVFRYTLRLARISGVRVGELVGSSLFLYIPTNLL
jgi:hypothetical protein